MLSGVLFDLDGTLLDIDLDSFFRDYFAALGPVLAEALGDAGDAKTGLEAVFEGTRAMSESHPGRTNREAFNERFHTLTGVDLDLEEYALHFERFYAQVFPTLRGTMGPLPGARRAVETALGLGLRVAVATNPIFPLAAIEERIVWSGIADLDLHAVTSYENMHATKPHPSYYIETADLIGSDPGACLMVGDDRMLDMSAADVGMRTFYVGSAPMPTSTWHGTLDDLSDLLPRLVEQDS